jgi:hypothetical protein
MNKDQQVDAVTLNEIIQRKLEGIANKIDIATQTPNDKKLGEHVRKILRYQKEISKHLAEVKDSHASK